MGTIYALLNKSKQEAIYIGGCGQKMRELMSPEYAQFVTYMLLTEWFQDIVIFVHDNNSFEYGQDFNNANDCSEHYWLEFQQWIK